MVRFVENEVRVMGRTASGVRGIDLDNAIVVGGDVICEGQKVLVVTEKGYGKMTPIEEYRLTRRGSKGVKALNVTDKNGNLVTLCAVNGQEDVIMITNHGMIIRISLDQVSTLKRATQGVRLINLKDNHSLATVVVLEPEEDEIESSEDSLEAINQKEKDTE